ncbi:hypothetical protein [Bacillus sp. B-jedd]|uniref:hypothetical protein n=1 Tax=Bacillus sp. B-jedd TaxID=1476857 RepID=UPI0005156E78|nr:hypothetical protein [Bacillus sp. B-jedd]CEG26006.1 hypothetical protein BN1002_00844 [Bacillus sp. B-jedd]
MKVKALVSFSGLVTMGRGEVKDIKDKVIIADLRKAGFVEEIKPKKGENDED